MSMAFGSDIGSSYEWRLGQRVFEVTRRNIDVNMLSFDGRNQRIQHALRSDGLDPLTADQEEIRRAPRAGGVRPHQQAVLADHRSGGARVAIGC